MYGLPVETTFVILAKPTLQCSQTVIYNFHSFNVWHNILGSWLQKVHKIKTKAYVKMELKILQL